VLSRGCEFISLCFDCINDCLMAYLLLSGVFTLTGTRDDLWIWSVLLSMDGVMCA
jgi:hypothetical protein